MMVCMYHDDHRHREAVLEIEMVVVHAHRRGREVCPAERDGEVQFPGAEDVAEECALLEVDVGRDRRKEGGDARDHRAVCLDGKEDMGSVHGDQLHHQMRHSDPKAQVVGGCSLDGDHWHKAVCHQECENCGRESQDPCFHMEEVDH